MEQLQEDLRKMQIETSYNESESEEEEEQPQQKKGIYTRRKPKEDDKRTTTSKSNIAKARASKLEKLKAMKKDRLEQELSKLESNSYEIQEEESSDSSDSSDGGEGFILKKVYEKPQKKAGKGKSHKEKYDENKRMDKIESILEQLSKQKAMREKPAKKVEKKTIIQIQQPQRQNNEQVDHLKKQILLKL
jgi:hypothetical protein